MTKTNGDVGAVPDREAVWPRRFLESTPTLGWTPNLADEEAIELSRAARKAAARQFGNVEPAPEADAPEPAP